jgi:hypothetical protein
MASYKLKQFNANSSIVNYLDNKFPDIKVIPGEDLNIERMKVRYLIMMLNDPDTYPTMECIAKDMNISERGIFRMIKRYGILLKTGRHSKAKN